MSEDNRARATAILAERLYEQARQSGKLPPGAPAWAALPAPERALWLRAVAHGFESKLPTRLARVAYGLAARGSRVLRRMGAMGTRARKLLK